MNVKIFADGADLKSIIDLNNNPLIKGFTTNPTLMRKAGIQDYEAFAKEVLSVVKDKPVSFEVFADDFSEMERQAKKIASWGPNVYVKIPVTDTKGMTSAAVVYKLTHEGIHVNVTGVFTIRQILQACYSLKDGVSSIVSVFAGRIADTGRSSVAIMGAALELCKELAPKVELLWASPRELYNIVEADNVGCHIITVSHELLAKIELFGKDLDEYSLDTVKMFYNDAQKAGYLI